MLCLIIIPIYFWFLVLIFFLSSPLSNLNPVFALSGEIPFFRFVIPKSTNFLLLENLYSVLLYHDTLFLVIFLHLFLIYFAKQLSYYHQHHYTYCKSIITTNDSIHDRYKLPSHTIIKTAIFFQTVYCLFSKI